VTNHEPLLLDCTLRDGGYHNDWDFPVDLIEEYLRAMVAVSVDFVELGFRSLEADGFRGGCAYTTDGFIRHLDVPTGLTLGVMVNTGELNRHESGVEAAIDALFTPADDSPVTLVRLASHFVEVDAALAACNRLHELGYLVGVNLMQIADRTDEEIEEVARRAAAEPPDVLYFADSLGGMDAVQTSRIIEVLRRKWTGPLGIHTHDNMGRALVNSLQAMEDGVTWIDATVTGMGRGPGNAKTEQLVIEVAERRHTRLDIAPLLSLVEHRFRPMQAKYGWGTNTYYYLAGKYGIHPTYVQAMLADSRYADEDMLAVLEHLQEAGGKKFSVEALETGLNFYDSRPAGTWAPASLLEGRDLLVLGSGPGVSAHRCAIVEYIKSTRPVVVAFNTDSVLDDGLIDIRIASHPFRLLSNAAAHLKLPQPLVTPASMLPESVRMSLEGKELLDFGLTVQEDTFEFAERHCVLPTSLTVAYALAIAASGGSGRVYLAGFDGYSLGDPRNVEVDKLLMGYLAESGVPELLAITPSCFSVAAGSVYSLI
jgi:4-hydroxy 2-oxovalerate aldolase